MKTEVHSRSPQTRHEQGTRCDVMTSYTRASSCLILVASTLTSRRQRLRVDDIVVVTLFKASLLLVSVLLMMIFWLGTVSQEHNESKMKMNIVFPS